MDVAIVSDTHIPSRAAMIPPAFEERIRAADRVLHAGDFDSAEAFDAVQEMAADGGDLTAVRGNTDPPSLDLPRRTRVDLGDQTFVLTHGDGPAHDYEERVAEVVREEADPDAVGISGHTHDIHDVEVGGVRLLNPGSATGATPADEATMMVADAGDASGGLDVTVHRA